MSRIRISLMFTLLAVLLIAAGLLLYPTHAATAAHDALVLCGNVLIPSLFPFFVLSGLVMESGLAARLGRLGEGLMRPLFRVCGAGSSALFLGLIGGFPVGAACAVELNRRGLCSKTETERLLAFCNNSGPAFLFGAVGAGVFHSMRIGLLLYAVHVSAAICTGILFRFYRRREPPGHCGAAYAPAQPFSAVFPQAVKNALFSTLNVCAFVLFFSVLLRILTEFHVIPALSRLLGGGALAQCAVTGCLEVTTGLCALSPTAETLAPCFILAATLLGFSGLSVHCQVLSLLPKDALSAAPYFCGKLLHAALSALFALCITQIPALFPQAVTAFAPNAPHMIGSAHWLFAWFALFLAIPIKKHWKMRR